MHVSSRGWKIFARLSARKLGAALAAVGLILFPSSASAHPMGNFSISHYTGIRITPDFIELRYIIDMAEIPTFQEMQQSGIAARPDDPSVTAFVASKAAAFAQGLQLSLNGHQLPLRVVSQEVIFPPGAGNLPTMKFGFTYHAESGDDCDSGPCELAYRDTNFPGRAGWKEIVVDAASGKLMTFNSASTQDRSALLSNYPTDLLNSPPQDLEARIVFSRETQPEQSANAGIGNGGKPIANSKLEMPAAPTVVSQSSRSISKSLPVPGIDDPPPIEPLRLEANRQATPRNAFTELMRTQKLGIGIVLLAALIAAGLGAFHALEPGHGKTIVAAYLVGSSGTARHAVLLGMIVTISHTAGVYLLGGVTLYAQKYILPEKIYPFLGVLSGILIAGMGFYLFLQRYVGGEIAHSHSHGAGVRHSDGGFWRTHDQAGEQTDENCSAPAKLVGKVSARQLLVLGITGGIVPCPAALVVLLSAVALHRVGFGLFLILAFSAGLAAVLIAMGLVAVYAGRMMSHLPTEGLLIQRWLPLTSAAMITVLGCVIAVRSLVTAGVVLIRF